MWTSPGFYVAVVSLIVSATSYLKSHTANTNAKAAVQIAVKKETSGPTQGTH